MASPTRRPVHRVPCPEVTGDGPATSRVRRDMADAAIGALLRREVSQPLHREPGDVVEERRRREEELPVARPPRALALRAVGGNVTGVAPEAPYRHVVEAVDAVVAATEPTGAAQVGVDD